MEWAGEVVAIGKSVTGFALGDGVMCSGAGGYAEYAVAEADRTILLSGARLSLTEAGVLPLALMTAHDAVIGKGALVAGETILVQGASSAIGLMALRIAAWRGARLAIGTSRDAERRSRLAAFGAGLALGPAAVDFTDHVMTATGGSGAELVIDMLAGDTLARSMAASAVRGRVVNVGRLAGNIAPAFDCDLHAARQIKYIGVTFRSRTAGEVALIVRRMYEDLSAPLAEGRLSLPVSETFALGDVAAAHARMRSNAHFGKLALLP
jgi:NADPH2:quinone reductase